jgi:hypothetical protein
MAEHDIHEDHGHSVAAWTGVAVILFGSLVMSLAVIFPSVFWFVVGAVICVIGAVAWKLLNMAGYGAVAHDGPDAPDTARPEVGVK